MFVECFPLPYVRSVIIAHSGVNNVMPACLSGDVYNSAILVVKALCYKPEGRGFDTQLIFFFNLPNPSGRTRPWGLLCL
jgi:hypothetical protein